MEPIVRRSPVAGTVAIAILLVSAHPATAAPGGARAETQDFDAAALSEARLLSAALNSLTGLTAAFTQTVESAALPSPQIERGIVYLLRPGRMRVEYLVPKGKLAIADGRRSTGQQGHVPLRAHDAGGNTRPVLVQLHRPQGRRRAGCGPLISALLSQTSQVLGATPAASRGTPSRANTQLIGGALGSAAARLVPKRDAGPRRAAEGPAPQEGSRPTPGSRRVSSLVRNLPPP